MGISVETLAAARKYAQKTVIEIITGGGDDPTEGIIFDGGNSQSADEEIIYDGGGAPGANGNPNGGS